MFATPPCPPALSPTLFVRALEFYEFWSWHACTEQQASLLVQTLGVLIVTSMEYPLSISTCG